MEYNTWLTLIPTALVLILALTTRKIITSLLMGILSAAIIATNFAIIPALKQILFRSSQVFLDSDTIYFSVMLFVVGTIISLVIRTGGAQAIGNIIIKKSASKKSAETASLMLSSSLFIDDYLNSLTTGYVMRNLTDTFKIPRVKLAFLIGTTSSIVVLAPISSWIGFLIGQLSSAGISLNLANKPLIYADPFFVYLKTIPFILYPIIMIISTWFIVRKKISFGPMYHHEKIAHEDGNLFGGKKDIAHNLQTATQSGSISDFILPIGSLIILIILGMPYSGGYHVFGGEHSFVESFQHAKSFIVLCFASLFSLILSLIFAIVRKKIEINEIPKLILSGIQMMFMSTIMILCAWVFGDFLKYDLNTGTYLANLILGTISINLMPLMIFLSSFIIALSIGSSWGTIAIITPIALPMLITLTNTQITPITPENIIMLLPCLGAIFAGALAGNNLSPISDVTFMASTSSGAYTVDLIQARFYYVLPAIIATAAGFLALGFLINKSFYLALFSSLVLGILISWSLLLLLQYLFHKKRKH